MDISRSANIDADSGHYRIQPSPNQDLSWWQSQSPDHMSLVQYGFQRQILGFTSPSVPIIRNSNDLADNTEKNELLVRQFCESVKQL